jgi:hypothetical protein
MYCFDMFPYNILFQKLSDFGLLSSFVGLLSSYIDNRYYFVRMYGKISHLVKSRMPQCSTLLPLLFNVRINDICESIHNS